MFSKVWVINVAIILAMLLSQPAFSQQCSWVVETDGNTNKDLIIVDGSKYFIFEEDKGRLLLKDVLIVDSLKSQNRIYEQIIETQGLAIKSEREFSATLLSDRRHYDALLESMLGDEIKDAPFYKTTEFVFVTGFISAALTYAVWQATYR